MGEATGCIIVVAPATDVVSDVVVSEVVVSEVVVRLMLPGGK